jgi:hypothetical protein
LTATGSAPDGSEQPPRIKVRIESLSDLVFGLALSIGSIILVGSAPPTSGAGIAYNVLIFGFSFAIIVLTWLGYSRTTAVLPEDVPYAVVTNLGLLFVVAIEPYLFYVLVNATTAEFADAASVAYALDVGGMFLSQAALAYLVVRHEKTANGSSSKPLHPVTLKRFRLVVLTNSIVGIIFVLSALPIFWVSTPIGYIRFDLWSSSFFLLGPLFRYRTLTRNAAG